MGCSNSCKGGSKKLCPVSFGLAVGVVGFFAVLIWSLWVIHYGIPPMMVEMHMPAPTLTGAFVHALLVLIKGFIFGFFVALFYDLFSCCTMRRKSDDQCGSGGCGSSPDKK